MSIRFISAEKFSELLAQHLVKAFGRTPSASTLANQFNLRAYGTKTITRETARKWLRGEAMPAWQNLNVLMNWLAIEPFQLYELIEQESNSSAAVEIRKESHRSIGVDPMRQIINEILKELQPTESKILALMALALRDARQIDDKALAQLLHSMWASRAAHSAVTRLHPKH